jgi:peptidase E
MIAMTRFIVHGGYTQRENGDNREFFAQITEKVRDGGTVLVVYFARPTEEWTELLKQDAQSLTENANGKAIRVVMASGEDFLDQIQEADAIYMRGGDTDKLIASLKQFPELSERLVGKTVAGSSAGAYAIARYYWSNTKQGIFEGFGWAPVKVICHFDGNQVVVDAMNPTAPELELIVLRDCEWKEILV